MKTYINTVWECWDYDVWGNEKEGYEVNDRYCICREYPIRIPVTVNNPRTPREFINAYPSDKQIREALGIKARVRLSLEGDDITIYVNHESTGYPLGEMHCVSHASLSPVNPIKPE